MSQVENSHYITRGVTKAWETKGRHLHFFDLKTDTLGCKPSSTLFTVPGLHRTETERTLSRRMEDSVGKYIQRCAKAGGELVDFNDDTRMGNALVALVALQVQRTQEALAPGEARSKLDELIANDEGFFDKVAAISLRDQYLVGGSIRRGDWMCFPSLGWFLIPLIGERPAVAMPLTPRVFVALVPRGAPTDHVHDMIEGPSVMCAFSIVGGGLEHKIVLPPAAVEGHDPTTVIAGLKASRASGRRLFNMIEGLSARVGGPAFTYRDE